MHGQGDRHRTGRVRAVRGHPRAGARDAPAAGPDRDRAARLVERRSTSRSARSPPALLVAYGSFWILGFVLYALIYAAAGSLVSRAEDLQVLALPLSLIAIVGYIQAVMALTGGIGPLVRFASYVPFWSPFVMLTRLTIGRVEPWELVLSFGLLVGLDPDRRHHRRPGVLGRRPAVRPASRRPRQSSARSSARPRNHRALRSRPSNGPIAEIRTASRHPIGLRRHSRTRGPTFDRNRAVLGALASRFGPGIRKLRHRGRWWRLRVRRRRAQVPLASSELGILVELEGQPPEQRQHALGASPAPPPMSSASSDIGGDRRPPSSLELAPRPTAHASATSGCGRPGRYGLARWRARIPYRPWPRPPRTAPGPRPAPPGPRRPRRRAGAPGGAAAPLVEGEVQQGPAVEVEHVEREVGQRPARARPPAVAPARRGPAGRPRRRRRSRRRAPPSGLHARRRGRRARAAPARTCRPRRPARRRRRPATSAGPISASARAPPHIGSNRCAVGVERLGQGPGEHRQEARRQPRQRRLQPHRELVGHAGRWYAAGSRGPPQRPVYPHPPMAVRQPDTISRERASELVRGVGGRAPGAARAASSDARPRSTRSGVELRVESLKRRSIKKASKLWALDLAIRMMDLTTLEGRDTPGKIRALCAKAIHPQPGDPSIPSVAADLPLSEPDPRGEGRAPGLDRARSRASRRASRPARPSARSRSPR